MMAQPNDNYENEEFKFEILGGSKETDLIIMAREYIKVQIEDIMSIIEEGVPGFLESKKSENKEAKELVVKIRKIRSQLDEWVEYIETDTSADNSSIKDSLKNLDDVIMRNLPTYIDLSDDEIIQSLNVRRK